MSNPSEGRHTVLEPAIHRARVERLTIFEITEAELETLERGTPVGLFLNLALFVLSAAMSFSVALTTTSIESDRTFTVFVIVTVVGYLAGATFLLLWYFTRKSIHSVTENIRRRLLPKGEPAEPDGTAE